ncbi:MAG: hypothetical protein JO168_07255 [Solirubrobacterales bacterium]|nr:hypothetical protein [Solirubrobacterales bacterium]
MPFVSTRQHGTADYATGAALLAAPRLLGCRDGVANAVLRGAGVAKLGLSATTDYELGLVRRVPVPVHLAIDAATGALLVVGAARLRRRRAGVASWLPHGVVGITEIALAAVTERRPSDRLPAASPAVSPAVSPAGSPAVSPAVSPAGSSAGEERAPAPAAAEPAGAEPIVPAPATAAARAAAEPTVPGPATGASAAPPSRDAPIARTPDDDILVAREEAAAAAAAARIGGVVSSASIDDPAMEPVYQAGGGEQEGWEETEAALIENATHGEGAANPETDAFTPELEADRSGAAYAEADSLPSTEVIEDREADEDFSGTHPRPDSEG